VRFEETGQVLAFFAVAVPVVLLPIVAYAVDATIVAGREAGLQAATAQAAETAAQQLNVAELRSSGALTLDKETAGRVATQALLEEERSASLDSIRVSGAEVTVVSSEQVTLPFSVFTQRVTLHASAKARLVTGFDAPV
jgi:Flp pilus assembly protein TadG